MTLRDWNINDFLILMTKGYFYVRYNAKTYHKSSLFLKIILCINTFEDIIVKYSCYVYK